MIVLIPSKNVSGVQFDDLWVQNWIDAQLARGARLLCPQKMKLNLL